MARDPDIERRLLDWGRYQAGLKAGAQGYASVDLTEERVDGGEGWDAEAPIPCLMGEVIETDKAVTALADDLRKTVVLVYVWQGAYTAIARRLGVQPPTVHARVWAAHRKLRMWLHERAEQARAETARVQARQAEARASKGGFYPL